ncbi:MAG: 6-bladed beta-propeller [Paramuribaculum sp.]|nr:6-bladed beta-propeller [Paramuribaculum sp.]
MKRTNLCNVIASFAATAAVMLAGCSKPEATVQAGEPVNFTAELRSQNSETAKEFAGKLHFRIVPLETTDSSIFKGSGSRILSADNGFTLIDYSQDKFLRFDKDGKYLKSIDRRGGGPEEYQRNYGASVNGGRLYVLDFGRIMVYDLDGNYLTRINGANGVRGSIAAAADGKIYLRKGFQNDRMLKVFSASGDSLTESFPSREVMRGFAIPRDAFYAIAPYRDGAIVTFATDPNVYYVSDTTSQVIATIDYPGLGLPSDFFDGGTEAVEDRYHNLRYDGEVTRAVVLTDGIIGSDNWLVYQPEYFGPVSMVFSDLRTGKSYTNRDLPAPLDVLLGTKMTVDGYSPSTDEFFVIFSSEQLKEMLEDPANSDALASWPELQAIDPAAIGEDDNDCVLFIKLD